MNDVAALEAKLEHQNREVNNQLMGVQTELKELTKALQALIRVEGEIKNVTALVSRIGKEVDDHEKRMRIMEKSNVINSIKIGAGERAYWMISMVALNILTGVIVYTVTR